MYTYIYIYIHVYKNNNIYIYIYMYTIARAGHGPRIGTLLTVTARRVGRRQAGRSKNKIT